MNFRSLTPVLLPFHLFKKKRPCTQLAEEGMASFGIAISTNLMQNLINLTTNFLFIFPFKDDRNFEKACELAYNWSRQNFYKFSELVIEEESVGFYLLHKF
jgi:hypothetical protein